LLQELENDTEVYSGWKRVVVPEGKARFLPVSGHGYKEKDRYLYDISDEELDIIGLNRPLWSFIPCGYEGNFYYRIFLCTNNNDITRQDYVYNDIKNILGDPEN